MSIQSDFRKKAFELIERAEQLFNIELPWIDITFDIKGKVSGYAGLKKGSYFMQFNLEAVNKYWDDMVNSTLAHELAHIITHVMYKTMKHDADWRRVDLALGGSGERCHNYDLTPARKKSVVRYRYQTPSGAVAMVGPKIHKKLQGYRGWSPITMKKTGEMIVAEQFCGAVQIR